MLSLRSRFPPATDLQYRSLLQELRLSPDINESILPGDFQTVSDIPSEQYIFIIENKMCTAYKDTFSLYTGRNTMSYNILHFRVHFLMFKSCFFAADTTAFAIECGKCSSRQAAIRSSSFSPASQNGTIIFTVGIAFVSVPVLSSTIVSASATASKIFRPLP